MPMAKTFKRGDPVEWNSEAGRVRGVIVKKLVSNIRLYGYVRHASNAEPQYVIKSVKTDHVGIQKGQALRRVREGAVEAAWRVVDPVLGNETPVHEYEPNT
jgi:hypothetical protein